ncbi:MAG: D-alanine--D-alanine ligase [Planctomycetota bacterium]|nr:MAG: D-alanine--D-alanine ligase [Planctomycetota bacterium]
MKAQRVLHLTHPSLVPPDSLEGLSEKRRHAIKTDWDVVTELRARGHEVVSVGVEDELRPIRSAVRSFKPHVVFNLVEGFDGLPQLDAHVVSYLELLGVPYTGCNPRGLVLARGKALSKKLLHYHRIRTPAFHTFPKGRQVKRPKDMQLPVIVKSLVEESSIGISQASVVDNEERLIERVGFIHDSIDTDAIAEEFIDGRELYVALLGNKRVTVMPPWELTFENLADGAPAIATERVKHDPAFQRRAGIFLQPARNLPDGMLAKLQRTSRRIYRILGLDGYARIDYRLSHDGKLYFLEANPNPEIARSEEFASAADEAGLPYGEMLERLISLALRRPPN